MYITFLYENHFFTILHNVSIQLKKIEFTKMRSAEGWM